MRLPEPSDSPIKLPLPPGKVLMFDHIKGQVRVEAAPLDAFGGWGNQGIDPDWRPR